MPSATEQQQADFVVPAQLCIGMHVHIDLPWSAHPFTFSSFKIKSAEQIAIIQGLGLEFIRYSPARSDAKPLAAPPPDAAAAPLPLPAIARDDDPACRAKQARVQRLAEQHAKAVACERELLSAARTIKSINQNIFSRPQEVKESAGALIKAMADSMLVESDVTIRLMADKVGGEDVYHHSLNVALLAMLLAKELKAPAPAVALVGMAALFHDIGELEIPDRVRFKRGARSSAEIHLMQMHCDYGVGIARKMGLSPEALNVIAQHHERVDGSGYPHKLAAAQLSLLSRIVALVDAYDELLNSPDPTKDMTPHEALSLMYAQQRAQFDPLVMSTFVRCMGVYPPGTLLVLSNGAVAMVVSVNTTKPLRPVVLVHDPAVPREEAIVVDLETEPDVTIARTMRPKQLSAEAFAYLSPRRRQTYYFDTEARA